MTLDASGVWVADSRRTLLEPTTVGLAAGDIVVVYGDPGHRHPLLALALGGRFVLGGGEVLADGDARPQTLHRKVALVDVPGVSDPDDVAPLTTVVAEELAMAGRPARKRHVEDWLTAHGLWVHREARMEDLPAGARTLALARLAAQRPGVEFLVLALPERWGVDPEGWLATAQGLADEGYGVLATTSVGVARHVEQQAPEETTGIRVVPFGNAAFSAEDEETT
ncbi:MAG: hypothetical protein J7518_11775 [Nocardioidaceae bacterium]|nr:hypothetical protein [Nocardioidaceae bacterium]